MNRKLVALCLIVSSLALLMVNACKKTEPDGIKEPITLVLPDSSIVRHTAGEDVSIHLNFTTDRPINWVETLLDIDTSQLGSYVPQYADTLFHFRIDTVIPRVNKYEYIGTFHVPDSLMPNSVVRFKAAMHAGKTTFDPGQNYPAGIQYYEKEFRIDVTQ